MLFFFSALLFLPVQSNQHFHLILRGWLFTRSLLCLPRWPPGQEGFLGALRPRLPSDGGTCHAPDLPTCLLPAPTYEAGVMVLVCLHVVLQDLLADVLGALVKVFIHAVRPGDGTLLSAIELLQERLTVTMGLQSISTLLWPPPCPPCHLPLSPDGTPASHTPPTQLPFSPLSLSQMQGTHDRMAKLYLSFKTQMESYFNDQVNSFLWCFLWSAKLGTRPSITNMEDSKPQFWRICSPVGGWREHAQTPACGVCWNWALGSSHWTSPQGACSSSPTCGAIMPVAHLWDTGLPGTETGLAVLGPLSIWHTVSGKSLVDQ